MGAGTATGSRTEETRRVLTRFYELVMAADLEGLLGECVHPDLVAEEPSFLPHAGVHRGRDAFARDVLPAAAQLIEFDSLRIESISADDDRGNAVVRARVQATGEEVILAEHWTVSEGKLTWLRVYVHDPAPLIKRIDMLAAG